MKKFMWSVGPLHTKILLLAAISSLLASAGIDATSQAKSGTTEVGSGELIRVRALGGLVNAAAQQPLSSEDITTTNLIAIESIASPPTFSVDQVSASTLDNADQGVVLNFDSETGSMPAAGVGELRILNESSSDFQIALRVDDLSDLKAESMYDLGFEDGTIRDYRAAFTMEKLDGTRVVYVVNAKKTLERSADGAINFSAPEFFLGVMTQSGLMQRTNNIAGAWDDQASTITWTVPRAQLNVMKAPVSIATPAVRTSDAAADGDLLSDFSVRVSTYFWASIAGVSPSMMVHTEVTGNGKYALGRDSVATNASHDATVSGPRSPNKALASASFPQ